MKIETHDVGEFTMEQPKSLEEWKTFVKDYQKVIERKETIWTRSRVTNYISLTVLIVVMLFKINKARVGYMSSGIVWVGAKLVMTSQFAILPFTLQTVLYIVTTLIAFL